MENNKANIPITCGEYNSGSFSGFVFKGLYPPVSLLFSSVDCSEKSF